MNQAVAELQQALQGQREAVERASSDMGRIGRRVQALEAKYEALSRDGRRNDDILRKVREIDELRGRINELEGLQSKVKKLEQNIGRLGSIEECVKDLYGRVGENRQRIDEVIEWLKENVAKKRRWL